MAAAPNAQQPVAWECGNCAHTNEGTEPGPCAGCAAPEPVCYMIFKKRPGLPPQQRKPAALIDAPNLFCQVLQPLQVSATVQLSSVSLGILLI